jgi:hypothetical protein
MVSSSSRKGLLPRSPYPRSKTLRNGRKDQPQQLNNTTTILRPPRCQRCRSQMTVADRKKSKRHINVAYFKTCQGCRDKRNSTRRKARTGVVLSNHNSSEAELDCSVCADTLPAQSFPNLSGCEHRPDVCRTCFLAWVTDRMDSTVWERIKCPSSDCRKLLTHEDVKAHAPGDVFARYVFVVRLLSSSIDSTTDSTICLSGIF